MKISSLTSSPDCLLLACLVSVAQNVVQTPVPLFGRTFVTPQRSFDLCFLAAVRRISHRAGGPYFLPSAWGVPAPPEKLPCSSHCFLSPPVAGCSPLPPACQEHSQRSPLDAAVASPLPLLAFCWLLLSPVARHVLMSNLSILVLLVILVSKACS